MKRKLNGLKDSNSQLLLKVEKLTSELNEHLALSKESESNKIVGALKQRLSFKYSDHGVSTTVFLI